jgi:hypothetical protein
MSGSDRNGQEATFGMTYKGYMAVLICSCFPDYLKTIDTSGLYMTAYDIGSVVVIAVEEVVGVVVGNPKETADPVCA